MTDNPRYVKLVERVRTALLADEETRDIEAAIQIVRQSEADRYIAIAESQDGRTEAYEELIAALEATRDG